MKTREEYLLDIKHFKDLNAEKFGIQSIGIFGSVARNEHHAGSDLDVFVELKNPRPFVMTDIQEALERICGCKVDVVRLRQSLRALLIQRIQKDGIYT